MDRNTAAFIMPVYTDNFSDFKEIFIKSIDSILNQTDNNLILVIIDDKSQDKTIIDFINDLIKKDNRVHLIKSKKNKGPGYARNLGIKYVYSLNIPFILFNDADDISDLNRLKLTREKFNFDRNINVVYSSFKVIDEKDNIVPYNKICDSIKEILDGHKTDIVEGEDSWIKIALVKNYTNLTSATSVRTSLAIKELFPQKRVSEDSHTWLRYGANPGKFFFANNFYTYYRIKTSTESSSRARHKNFYKLKAATDIEGYKKAEKIYIAKNNKNIDKNQLKINKAKFLYKESISIALGNDYKTASKILKSSLKLNAEETFKNILSKE